MPELHSHFDDIPDLLWINKWFQTCFLYSFPLGLCIRIWDNILADGTKFFFKVALAILRLVEGDLLQLEMTDINEFFKRFIDSDPSYPLLPDYEKIIQEANKFKITDAQIELIAKELDGNVSSLEDRLPSHASVSHRGPDIVIDPAMTSSPTPQKKLTTL